MSAWSMALPINFVVPVPPTTTLPSRVVTMFIAT